MYNKSINTSIIGMVFCGLPVSGRCGAGVGMYVVSVSPLDMSLCSEVYASSFFEALGLFVTTFTVHLNFGMDFPSGNGVDSFSVGVSSVSAVSALFISDVVLSVL